MSFIELEGATFTWPGAGSPAVSGVDLRIEEGEYVAIIGPNGSGKSSLLRLLNGLRRADSGRVRVAGLDAGDPDQARAVRSSLVLVFQSPPDQIVSTVVEEDVAFGPGNLLLPREEIRARVEEALALVGLGAERCSPPHFLSAGQQQRLAVAGALAMRPRCIAFDEATAMLDPPSRAAFLELMDELNARGVTIIHVTHDMNEAARARRLILMEGGRVTRDTDPERLFGSGALPPGILLPPAALLARALGLPARPGESARDAARRIVEAFPDGPGPASPTAGPRARPLSEGSPVFRLEEVSFAYLKGTLNERRALRKVSFSVPAGAILALVGHTGSGKSTVLQLLNSLASPGSGRVLSFGLDPAAPKADLRALRMRSPLAIQRPESALFEAFAGDDVAFGPRNQGLAGAALVARVRKAMDLVGLPFDAFRDRAPRALSGGERRRLALAGVLALEPEALLLDEPTQALDPAGKAAVMGLIAVLAREGRSIVFSTHSMEEAARADLVAVLGSGELLAFGPPRAVFGEAYDPAWGVGRPWAAELARELAEAGRGPAFTPLDVDELAAALAPSPSRAEREGGRP